MEDCNGNQSGREWQEIAHEMTRERDSSKLLDLAQQLTRAFDGQQNKGNATSPGQDSQSRNADEKNEGAENSL